VIFDFILIEIETQLKLIKKIFLILN